MNAAEIKEVASVFCSAFGVVVFLLGGILGALLETKFNFWKW